MLTAIADDIMERRPGWRVEIMPGQLVASPLRDAHHAGTLTTLMRQFFAAGLHDGATAVVQGVAVKLPGEPDDYAVPDLSVVDADVESHHVQFNAYAPACFRLVLEVTSESWAYDLHRKDAAYAEAEIPVYVVVDREHQRLHVLTDPDGADYTTHRVHTPGETVTLPGSLGAEVTLDVGEILAAGRAKSAPGQG
ncbi:hypothetical protein SUDANB145_02889 [Streptomyces sp. enrichment culture]|uniref:Uma2 family endonuclease n=1 Tax=Streptomyces sp. enrichment culture TaxID=1795815 RepID=UPI003F57BB6C